MIQNPILKVLSTFQKHRVESLLIGGQACIVYGAAEFSRDSDFLIRFTRENLKRVLTALKELQAEPIFFPPFRAEYLQRGHACHFRCHAPGVENLRIDLMVRMRGCDEFPSIKRRRKRVTISAGFSAEIIGLHDLVRSKKTQRDKDWLMLKRLVINDIYLHRYRPKPGQFHWWLKECRSAETLIELAKEHPRAARLISSSRPLLFKAINKDMNGLEAALREEEEAERKLDRAYWTPLKQELEKMRMQVRHRSGNK